MRLHLMICVDIQCPHFHVGEVLNLRLTMSNNFTTNPYIKIPKTITTLYTTGPCIGSYDSGFIALQYLSVLAMAHKAASGRMCLVRWFSIGKEDGLLFSSW